MIASAICPETLDCRLELNPDKLLVSIPNEFAIDALPLVSPATLDPTPDNISAEPLPNLVAADIALAPIVEADPNPDAKVVLARVSPVIVGTPADAAVDPHVTIPAAAELTALDAALTALDIEFDRFPASEDILFARPPIELGTNCDKLPGSPATGNPLNIDPNKLSLFAFIVFTGSAVGGVGASIDTFAVPTGADTTAAGEIFVSINCAGRRTNRF